MRLDLDQDGHLVDYTIWNKDVAQELARSLDLELTEWHFNVLNAVRQFYQQFGHSPATRPLIKYLMKTVDANIDNAVLQQAFKTGLVARHFKPFWLVFQNLLIACNRLGKFLGRCHTTNDACCDNKHVGTNWFM